jgi:hypothetical protein
MTAVLIRKVTQFRSSRLSPLTPPGLNLKMGAANASEILVTTTRHGYVCHKNNLHQQLCENLR